MSEEHVNNNKTLRFNIKKPIEKFCGRSQELEDLHKILNKNHIVTITGLGGIGKTELVRKYIEIYNHEFENNIIWINSENKEHIQESYRKICVNKLGISSRDIDGNCKDLNTLYDDICKYIDTRKLLIIYDNAYKLDIEVRLPNIYIVVTSRNKKYWNTVSEIIDLKVFNETEAVDYINKSLCIEYNTDYVVKLARKLEYFPLILYQATMYINESVNAYKNIGREYTIEDYLNEFDLRTEKLLRYRFLDSEEMLYTTWSKTFELISTNVEYGKVANEILDVISFLDSQNIPVDYFIHSNSTEHDKRELCFALELLKSFSVISTEVSEITFNVNPLLQLVRRLHMKSNGIYESVQYKILQLNLHILENKNDVKVFLTHLDVSVECLYKDFVSENFTNVTLMLYFIVRLSDTYISLGEYYRLKNISERALQLLNKNYKFGFIDLNNILAGENNLRLEFCYTPDQIILVRILFNLITSLKCLGEYKNYISIRDKCVQNLAFVVNYFKMQQDTKEMFFSNFIDSENLVLMKNLSVYLCKFNEFPEASELLERVLRIETKVYDDISDIRLLETLNNLSLCVANIDNLERAKYLLEKCLIMCDTRCNIKKLMDIKLCVVLNNLAVVLSNLDEYTKCKKILKFILRIEEKIYGICDIRLCTVLHNLSVVLEHTRGYLEQIEILERILYINEIYYGLKHIETAKALFNLARVNGFIGYDYEKIRLLNLALEIEELYYSNNEHIDLVLILINLAEAYGNLSDYETKKCLLERVLTIQEKYYADIFYLNNSINKNEIAVTLFDLAIVNGVLNELDEQRLLLEKCLRIKLNIFGTDNIETAIIQNALGYVFACLENYIEAELLFKKALDVFKNYYGEDSFYTAIVMKNLANVLSDASEEKVRLLVCVTNIEEKYYSSDK